MHATPYIEIDLSKVVANYQLAVSAAGANCKVAAVVKANAYGLGAKEIAKRLYEAGCREFYVAYIDEYLEIKDVVGAADVFVLMVSYEEEMELAVKSGAIPVLYSYDTIAIYKKLCVKHSVAFPCSLHIDTAMNRQGLSYYALDQLDVNTLNIKYMISHPACSDDPKHPLNALQLERVRALSAFGKPISFCNSDAIFLGAEYHFSQVRPGCMLYGIGARKGRGIQNPLKWCGKVIQIKGISKGESVSYCARYTADSVKRIATVACGYADGYKRMLTNKGSGYFMDYKLPQVGTVTMDMIMFDVSSVPENLLPEMKFIELLNDSLLMDDLALLCDTIGYEIITSLGNRVRRIYK